MALDNNQLDKIVGLVKYIKDNRIAAGESFLAKLREVLEHKGPSAMVVNNDKVDHIYEYCIEEKVGDQATKLYENFSIKELIPKLQQIFVEMEFARRKDDFCNFCGQLYKQIECIFSVMANDPEVEELARKLYLQKRFKKAISEVIFYQQPKEKSEQPISNLYAMDQAALLIYLLSYKPSSKQDKFIFADFSDVKGTVNDIYTYRNQNFHAGKKTITPYQEAIIERVNKSYNYYYLKFYGTLAWIIDRVNNNYPIKDEMKDYVANRQSETTDGNQ